MKLKFTEKRLYKNYPLYSENLGEIDEISIKEDDNGKTLYYKCNDQIYDLKGKCSNDQLYFEIPFKYTNSYLELMKLIGFICMIGVSFARLNNYINEVCLMIGFTCIITYLMCIVGNKRRDIKYYRNCLLIKKRIYKKI